MSIGIDRSLWVDAFGAEGTYQATVQLPNGTQALVKLKVKFAR